MRLASIVFITLDLISQSSKPLPWATASSRFILQTTKINPVNLSLVKLPVFTGDRRIEIRDDGTLEIIDQRKQIIWRGSLPGRRSKIWLEAGTPLSLEELKALRFPESTLYRNLHYTDGDPRLFLNHLIWFIDDGENYLTCLNPITLKIEYLKLPEARGLEFLFAPSGIVLITLDKQWLIPWIDLNETIRTLNVPYPKDQLGTAFKPFPSGQSQGVQNLRSNPIEDQPKVRVK